MNLTKEELQQQLKAMQQEEDDKIIREALPYFESFKGKCYKTKNYYSGEKSWWLYTKVLDVKEEDIYVSSARALSNCELLTFQTDSYGKTIIEKDHSFIHSIEKYTEITLEEFNKAFSKTIGDVTKMIM